MQMLSEVVLVNSVTAALLALLVTILTRFIRRPAALHALWLMVLLKLVTPPVLRVEALPALDATGGAAPATLVESLPPGPPISTVTVEEATPPLRISPAGILVGAWASGSLFLIGLVAVRCVRFRRLVGESTPASPDLRRRAAWLAERVGLRRCPVLRVIDGRLPPMLWSRPGPGELLFPAGLLRRLGPGELDTLIVHELAHVRRRDHWVRWVETAVVGLFWWNPVAWWARRNLRIAEEKSCDAWVLALLPGGSRSYAEGILKTVDYISGGGPRLPVLATGAAEARHLKERLTMIMSPERPLRTRPTQRWALALLALALLLVFPTSPKGTAAAGPHEVERDESYREALLELERESLELEYRLSRIQAHRMEIEVKMAQEATRAELERLRKHGEELRLEGRDDEAALMEHKLREQERRRELEADLRMVELRHQVHMRQQEFDMQRAALALEEARLAEDTERAEELEQEVRELDLELRRAALDELRRREQLEQESLSMLETQTREQALEQERLDRMIAELMAKLEAVERAGADGDAANAAGLEQAARELRRVLDKLRAEQESSGVR